MSILTGIALAGLIGGGGLTLSKNGKSSQFFGGIKNALTTTAIPRLRPQDYTNVKQVVSGQTIENKAQTTWDKILKTIKAGHILGGGWILASLIPFGIRKIFDFDSESTAMKAFSINLPIALLGGLGSIVTATFARNDFEASMINLVDDYVERVKISKDKKISDSKSGGELGTEDYVSFDDVILGSDRGKIIGAVRNLQRTGQILNLWGITGTGKTMTADSLADLILKQDFYDKDSVQIWKANSSAIDKALADDDTIGSWLREIPGLGRLFGETITERLERLVANAVKHYRDTGEFVVIVFDEAHELLATKQKNSIDPFDREKLKNALQRFFDNTLLQSDCKGVILALTSNSSVDQFPVTMFRRLVNVEYKRPDKERRIELIKNRVKVELETALNANPKLKDITLSSFTEEDFDKLASIGTVNLFKEIYKEKESSLIDDGLSPASVSHLEKRDMLHHAEIKQVINLAMLSYEGGGKEQLLLNIGSNLQAATKESVSRRFEWRGEISQKESAPVDYYFGRRGRASEDSRLVEKLGEILEEKLGLGRKDTTENNS